MWNDPSNNAEKTKTKTRTKSCIVGTCKSTSTRKPNKRFLAVPNNVARRAAWLNACGRDPQLVSTSARLYVCEDHFNFEEDASNYMHFKYYPGQRVFLKAHVVPHILRDPELTSSEDESLNPTESSSSKDPIFSLHKDKSPKSEKSYENLDDDKAQTPATNPRSHGSSETETASSSENEEGYCSPNEVVEAPASDITSPRIAVRAFCLLSESEPPSSLNKSVQTSVSVKENYVAARPYQRSKYVQCNLLKSEVKYAKTSMGDFEIVDSGGKNVTFFLPESPSTSSNKSVQSTKNITPQSADYSTTSSQSEAASGSSGQYKGTLTSEDMSEDLGCKLERSDTIQKIQSGLCLDEPMYNLGLPRSHVSLITTLGSCTKTDPLHIMICLKKIRLNQAMKGLGADFGFSESHVTKIFQNVIPRLAQCLSSFVLWPSKIHIKEKMPLAFRARFANVQSIIECFEIEIEKPSDPIKQTLTWSSYKQCNTMKYLFSCTPDGYINFVSKGFGGRTLDTKITEISGFLDVVPEHAGIMADRGFKSIAKALEQVNCVLIRPPSVSAGVKSSEEEVRMTKRIASLRIHIERVIGRVREFDMLKPHACVHHNLVRYLDYIVTTVCGLVNLQSSLMNT